MSITTGDALAAVKAMLPDLTGWPVYDGMATGDRPPWIVVTLSEVGRDLTESVGVSDHMAKLDIRVVARTARSVDIVADKLQRALDGRTPAPGMGVLMPDQDSGIYPSELTVPDSPGITYVMRVLTWRTGWTA
jgi:hypothetical protein